MSGRAATELGTTLNTTQIYRMPSKTTTSKTACPHCGKTFVKVNLHITKMHQTNEIVFLKGEGFAARINGKEIARWPSNTQDYWGPLYSSRYDFDNGYELRTMADGTRQVLYLHKGKAKEGGYGWFKTYGVAFKKYNLVYE